MNILYIIVWIKNKGSGIERRVISFIIVLIKGLLPLPNSGAKLLIRSMLRLLYGISLV